MRDNHVERERCIILIVGPTAVGKTAVGVEVAERLGTEIINADSRQLYRLMDIGSAKPTAEERSRVRHHMVDIIYPDERFSAADFAAMARRIIDDLLKAGKTPLVVGGSGLYMRGILKGFFEDRCAGAAERSNLVLLAERHGRAFLHRMLEGVDPEAASRIHPNDLMRMVRALQVYRQTGKPISYWQRQHADPHRYSPIVIGLNMERSELYRRIDIRADGMMEEGLLEEVKDLRRRGYGRGLVSMSGLGYRHLSDHLDERLSLDEAVRLMKRDTRRYAKRQLTWFRHMEGVRWVDLDPRKDVVSAAAEVIDLIVERTSEPLHQPCREEVRRDNG